MTSVALRARAVLGWTLAGTLVGTLAACAAHQPAPASTLAWPAGDPEAGRDAFIRVGCAACHAVEGAGDMPEPVAQPPVPVTFGRPAPSRPTAERLVEAIVNPDVHIAESHRPRQVQMGDQSRMGDFTRVLTVRELIDIVAFLQSLHDGAS